EIIDEQQLDAVNRYSRTDYPAAPTLFFEFHGISQSAVDEQARAVQEIASENGAIGFRWSSTPEERATLWQARHNALYATMALRPGAKPWTSDVCVPISQLATCILETQDDLRTANIVAPLVGHAGDGNFHLIFMVDIDDHDDMSRVKAANARLVERALRLGGTRTGEPGVGLGQVPSPRAGH